jgi:hypothetical protein
MTEAEASADAPTPAVAPEAEASADAPTPAVAPEAAAQTRDPAPEGDLLAQTDAEAASEVETTEQAPENNGGSPRLDDSLGPALLDVSRDAKSEAPENTLASELPDIPIQDLLSDLVSVGQRLGIAPRARAEPDSEGDSAEAECSQGPAAAVPAPTGYRRYALHTLLLGLILAVAIAVGVMNADQLASSEPNQDQRPPATVTTVPGVVVRQEHPGEIAGQPTPEATPQLRPTYFRYTVQPGDTVSSVVKAFDISLDFVFWNNPDAIDDPNLLLAGDELLIPSVAGTIYHVKPGDVISVIGRRLPERRPENPGLHP